MLAGNLFLLSNIFLWLASFCAYRLYEIESELKLLLKKSYFKENLFASFLKVAERVASERAEACGNGNSTGYQIRLEARLPRQQGCILYCTNGILLKFLESDP